MTIVNRDEPDEDVRWDFFLAHAGADVESAGKLYDLLSSPDLLRRPQPVRVFLASRCLKLGDDWDVALARAQRSSKVTVVLVSGHTGAAYYEREEVAAAIALAREDDTRHRVVPLFLGVDAESRRAMPYGLRLKHGLEIPSADGLASAAIRLLELLEDLEGAPVRPSAKAAVMDAEAPSLEVATEETHRAVTAAHAITYALREAVKFGLDTLDLFKSRRERARLIDLLNRLGHLRSRQTSLPGLLHLYALGELDWAIIASDIEELARTVTELLEMLATGNGPFLIRAQQAYQSLLFGLHGRSRIYEELSALETPSSPKSLARLPEIASKYQELMENLGAVQGAIVEYLDKE